MKNYPLPPSLALGLACFVGSLAPASAQSIFFIGGAAEATQGADAAVMTFLQERYGTENVTYKQASTTVADEEDDFDVLVISSTPGSGAMRNKFHDSAIPVVNWEEAIADNGAGEFMITAGRPKDNVATDHVITIVEDHPITAGFAVGSDVTISTGQTEVWWSNGQQAPGSLSLAHEMGDETRMFLTIVEQGGALNDGTFAENRRVMLGMTDNTFNSFTDDMKTIFGQSIDWALGISGSPEELRIRSIEYDEDTDMITIVWNSEPGRVYALESSADLAGWPGDLGDNIQGTADSDTTSYTFAADLAFPGRSFFRIRDVTP